MQTIRHFQPQQAREEQTIRAGKRSFEGRQTPCKKTPPLNKMRSSNAKLIVIAQAASGGRNRYLTPRSANFNRKPPTARFPLPALAARSRRIFLTVRFPASASGRPLSGVHSPTARKPARRKAARKIRMQNSRAKLYARNSTRNSPACKIPRAESA